jgi:phosphoribosylamine--glycine ligase
VRVLLIGSGGREHALAWTLTRSPSLTELHAAPGNPGIAAFGSCHPVGSDDAEGLLALAGSLGVELVVIGPEAPLVAGLGDLLRHSGIAVYGPSAAAARIEGSKRFAKDVMAEAGVATARRLDVPAAPCVVKADGLAAGKGVVVCRTDDELRAGLDVVRAIGGDIVVEELLDGPEVSVLALCDGATAVALPTAQDFKRAYDGDEGPNTGGMGSYAPVPGLTPEDVEGVLERVHRPVLHELARRGTPFVGTLFAGLMLTADGPRVLEFNCRFGDPETQSLLPLVDADLLQALAAAARGELAGVEVGVHDGAAVTVVLAAGDYPAGSDRGAPITGVDDAERAGALVFHAGTALRDGALVTNGGRILNVTATAPTLAEARSTCYDAASLISWPGVRRRDDIAAAAAAGATVSLASSR